MSRGGKTQKWNLHKVAIISRERFSAQYSLEGSCYSEGYIKIKDWRNRTTLKRIVTILESH